jgi:hypothetical protein
MPRFKKAFDNNMRGVLFENDKKTRGDNQPEMKGSVEIEGVSYWVSGWWKRSEKVKGEFLSLTIQEKEDKSPQERNRDRGERHEKEEYQESRQRSYRGDDEPRRGGRTDFDQD